MNRFEKVKNKTNTKLMLGNWSLWRICDFLRFNIRRQILPLEEKVYGSVDQARGLGKHSYRSPSPPWLRREQEPDLPQHSTGHFLRCPAQHLLEKLIIQNWYPRAFSGEPVHPQPIPCAMKISSHCILKQSWRSTQRGHFHHECSKSARAPRATRALNQPNL